MPLVEEGTEVWRPVHGERQTGETFRVLGPTRQGEAWAFQPGSIVRCALRRFVISETFSFPTVDFSVARLLVLYQLLLLYSSLKPYFGWPLLSSALF